MPRLERCHDERFGDFALSWRIGRRAIGRSHLSEMPVNQPSENVERFVPTRRSIEAKIPSRLLKIASREDKFARIRDIIRDLAASADFEEGYKDMREAFEILTEPEK